MSLKKKKAKVKQVIIEHNDNVIQELEKANNQDEYDKIFQDYIDNMSDKILEVLEIKE